MIRYSLFVSTRASVPSVPVWQVLPQLRWGGSTRVGCMSRETRLRRPVFRVRKHSPSLWAAVEERNSSPALRFEINYGSAVTKVSRKTPVPLVTGTCVRAHVRLGGPGAPTFWISSVVRETFTPVLRMHQCRQRSAPPSIASPGTGTSPGSP